MKSSAFLVLATLAILGCSKTIDYRDYEFEEKIIMLANGVSFRINIQPCGYSEIADGKQLKVVTSAPYSIRCYVESENKFKGTLSIPDISINGRKLSEKCTVGAGYFNRHINKFVIPLVVNDIDIEYHDVDMTIVLYFDGIRQEVKTRMRTNYKEGKMSPLMRGMLSV